MRIQAAAALLILGALFAVFLVGSQIALNASVLPWIAVTSSSMCVGDGSCNGWAHPFENTLHVGDLVLIEGVNVINLNVNYPDSDVIAFYNPAASNEIVFRRIVNSTINGDVYLYVKGDGNAAAEWPAISDYYVNDVWIRSNASTPVEPINQGMILGKVVMRVPWVGNMAVFLHEVVGVENRFVSVTFMVLLAASVMLVLFVPKLLRRKLLTAEQNLALSKA